MTLDRKLLSPKEPPLFVLGMIFSTLVWLVAVVGTLGIGLVYIGLAAFFILTAHAVFLAHVRGNGIRISRNQLPDLYARCEAAALKLGLERMPEVYLMQQGGVLNAFATKLLSRRFVIIYSDLADACADPRQLDFVIGHEIGHLAAGHLAWNAFLAPFRVVPWLGPAYSRAREYTCDRCGLHAVEALEPALRGLAVLAAGGRLAQQVDVAAFAAQRLESGRFWMATAELCMSHPYLCKRVAALQEFWQPGTVPVVRRTPLAYPLAPVLGFTVGGSSSIALLTVFYIGVLAAIAIPNYKRFQERAAAAALQRQQVTPPWPDTDDEEEESAPPSQRPPPRRAR
jgi:Zn-dependent protease with chaperone function